MVIEHLEYGICKNPCIIYKVDAKNILQKTEYDFLIIRKKKINVTRSIKLLQNKFKNVNKL